MTITFETEEWETITETLQTYCEAIQEGIDEHTSLVAVTEDIVALTGAQGLKMNDDLQSRLNSAKSMLPEVKEMLAEKQADLDKVKTILTKYNPILV